MFCAIVDVIEDSVDVEYAVLVKFVVLIVCAPNSALILVISSVLLSMFVCVCGGCIE